METPRLDVNYGVGQRIQLKLEIPWVQLRRDDGRREQGPGDATTGVKWRFLGEGRTIAWSVYPQVEFNTARSSVNQELVDAGPDLQLPTEITLQVARVEINAATVLHPVTPMTATPQVVMITGASAGVGRAVARLFASRGAAIGLFARGRAGLEGAARDVEELGGRALVLQGDVADPDRVESAAATLEETFGPIDVWINNAMASVFSPVIEMEVAEYKRVTEVTYLGVVHGTLAALRRMKPRNRGVIVQVGSALAYRGIPLQSAYCAAKHAVEGFCDSLHAELLHDRSAVQVTMVQLPALNTPQFDWVKSRLRGRAQPVPPIFQPEVAADAIVWAADHPRREYFVGFPTVEAIVGDRIAAGLGDRYLARVGYKLQQTSEAEDPNRPHNLWHPVDEDRDCGAHGRFDDAAHSTSLELTLSKHRSAFAAAAVLIVAASLFFIRR